MLIGLLCEEMSAVIVAEKESMVVSFVKRKPIVLEEIDEDDVISKVKFDEGTDAVAALGELDVYVLKLVGLFNFPFEAEPSDDGMEFKKKNGNT